MSPKTEIKEFSGISITTKTSEEYIQKLGKNCQKCGHCCKYDSGFTTEEDIERISKTLNITKEELIGKYFEEIERYNTKRHKPKLMRQGKPYGPCIFYHPQKQCLIHDVKPTGCRLGTCVEHGEQISIWTMLHYFVKPSDPESIRQWAVYLKTHPTIPGGRLTDLVPEKERLEKILNYEILK